MKKKFVGAMLMDLSKAFDSYSKFFSVHFAIPRNMLRRPR